MFAPVVAYMDAAVDALDAAASLSDVVVFDGPLVTYDDLTGADLVIVGDDLTDDRGTGAEFEGGWHGVGANAPQSGEAQVFVAILSQSGAPVTMRARRTAALALHTAVSAVLFATASTSNLGVDGVAVAEQTSWRMEQIPTAAGPTCHLVIAIRLILTPA